MIVYENEGHRRRMMRTYFHFAWKIIEWRRDPYCRSCKKLTWLWGKGESKDQATIDHIIARSMGGTDTEDNFQLLCSGCNGKKSKKENVVKRVNVNYDELKSLRHKSDLLDALKKEGIKKLPIWESAQLRLKNSIDNSGS